MQKLRSQSCSFCLALSAFLTLNSILFSAAPTSPSQQLPQNQSITPQPNNWKEDLKAINMEIQTLSKELTDLRREALNAEMKAQPQMIDSWHEFAKNIRISEEDEKRISDIQKQIRALHLRKQELIRRHGK